MVRLIYVRHGETVENVRGIMQGQTGPGRLSALGRWQAKQAGNWLGDEIIDATYSSPLERALHTCQAIASHHPKLKIKQDVALVEKHYGPFDGASIRERNKAVEASGRPFHEFKPRGAESSGDVQKRVIIFLKKIVKKHPNETVLLVSHANTLGLLTLHLLEKPIEDYIKYRPQNTAINIVRLGAPTRNTFEFLNSTEHLKV